MRDEDRDWIETQVSGDRSPPSHTEVWDDAGFTPLVPSLAPCSGQGDLLPLQREGSDFLLAPQSALSDKPYKLDREPLDSLNNMETLGRIKSEMKKAPRNSKHRLALISLLGAWLVAQADDVEPGSDLDERKYRPYVATLREIVEPVQLSPAYHKKQGEILSDLIHRLLNDRQIQFAQHHWANEDFDDLLRMRVLEDVLGTHCDIQRHHCFCPEGNPSVQRFYKAGKKMKRTPDLTALCGEFIPQGLRGDIRINIHPDTKFQDALAGAANTILHENAHAGQYAVSLADDWLPANLSRDRRTLRTLYQSNAFVSSQVWSVYRHQCVEDDAWRVGDAVEGALREKNPKAAWADTPSARKLIEDYRRTGLVSALSPPYPV